MFRLERKIGRMLSIQNGRLWKSRRRAIVAIRPVAAVPVRCIAVDSPSHLFLCGKSWIPTHNTEMGSNWIGYVIHHAPGPMMAVWPTVDMAKRNSKQRIDPLIEESAALSALIAPARSRDSGNTILTKEFRGGVLVMTGANSAVGLRSMPVRYLFLDEVDGYPLDVEGEGDAISLAEARTRTFTRRKHMQWLRFEQLRWSKGLPAGHGGYLRHLHRPGRLQRDGQHPGPGALRQAGAPQVRARH
jgi:hypothetical protein